MAVYDPTGGGGVAIDEVLTNISVALPNEGFVGDRLFPTVRVRKQSAKYYVFGREAWVLEPGSDVRAPGTEANEIPGMKLSRQPYYAEEHALQIAVTDEERENTVGTPVNPDRDGTELVTSKLLLGRELAIKDFVYDSTNYPVDHVETLSGGDQWQNYSTSDPIGDMKRARRKVHSKIFIEPNLAVIPYEVMSVLEDHPDFIDRIKYSQAGVVTEDIIARLFNIQTVIVPGVAYNSARMGQAESLGYLWGKTVGVFYVPPRPAPRTPAFGYEFAWVYPGGQVQVVERWREIRRKSDVIRTSRRYDLRTVALDGDGNATAGYLIKNAVA
jgi:hypothetical protein